MISRQANDGGRQERCERFCRENSVELMQFLLRIAPCRFTFDSVVVIIDTSTTIGARLAKDAVYGWSEDGPQCNSVVFGHLFERQWLVTKIAEFDTQAAEDLLQIREMPLVVVAGGTVMATPIGHVAH